MQRLYPEPPYHYEECRRLGIWFHAEKEAIRELIPPPLEPISDLIEVFVMRATKITGLAPYDEGGIVIPCRFEGVSGGYIAYEYVSTDDSLCAGREIWGHPKMLADVKMDEYGDRIEGWVMRKGKRIISVTFSRDDTVKLDRPKTFPRFLVKKIPRADGPGFDVENIVSNTYAPDSLKVEVVGSGRVFFEPSDQDPVYRLEPKKVIGGIFTVGQFWLRHGKVVRRLDTR